MARNSEITLVKGKMLKIEVERTKNFNPVWNAMQPKKNDNKSLWVLLLIVLKQTIAIKDEIINVARIIETTINSFYKKQI